MAVKLIIRVTPDERVHVAVEGLTEPDRPKPKGRKLCERMTRRLEQDLGAVESRDYRGEPMQAIEVDQATEQRLGE